MLGWIRLVLVSVKRANLTQCSVKRPFSTYGIFGVNVFDRPLVSDRDDRAAAGHVQVHRRERRSRRLAQDPVRTQGDIYSRLVVIIFSSTNLGLNPNN